VVIIWLAWILAQLVAQLRVVQFTQPRSRPQERTNFIALGTPLIVALVMHVCKLTTLPYNLDGDFAAIIPTAEQKSLVPQLQQRFPGGTLDAHPGDAPGEVVFYVFRLP